MSTTPENKIGFAVSKNHLEMGYGKFPYVIIRLHYATYLQMPIHFVKEQQEGLKGILIQTPSEDVHEQQSLLLNAVWQFKQQIDTQKNNSHRLCVVLNPHQAYYFDTEGLAFSTSIPTGGTLIANQNEFVAMAHPHYVESKNTVSHG
jgi:hypothetical protein